MWENINGEWIYMDKEMGSDEYARQNSSLVCGDYALRRVPDRADRLSAGGVAVGVAGGMIAAKVVSRIGSWLLWIAFLAFVVMVIL